MVNQDVGQNKGYIIQYRTAELRDLTFGKRVDDLPCTATSSIFRIMPLYMWIREDDCNLVPHMAPVQ